MNRSSVLFVAFSLLGLVIIAGCEPPIEAERPKPKPVAQAKTPEPAQPEAKVENTNRIHQLSKLERVDITIGDRKLDCWVMDDESKTQEGMMFLTDAEVKENQGMIFAFKESRDTGFWMHNTLIPLDIIYIDSTKTVVDIEAGKKEDDTSLTPNKKYQYVLELKQGQASKNGIKIGSTLNIPTSVVGKD